MSEGYGQKEALGRCMGRKEDVSGKSAKKEVLRRCKGRRKRHKGGAGNEGVKCRQDEGW